MEIFDKLFSYVDNSRDLTTSMLNNYKNSLIVLGDQKQMYIPMLNSYIGLGMDAYNYLIDTINNLTVDSVFFHPTDENHNYHPTFIFSGDGGPATSYVSSNIIYNPYHEFLQVKTFVGELLGNAATTTKLKESVNIWGHTFDGTQDVNTDIIPKENSKQSVGTTSYHFAYAYIDTTIGDLQGNAQTATYSDSSYISNYSYTSLIYTKYNGIYPVSFVNSNEKNMYFSYSYVTNMRNFVLPNGLDESDLFDVHNIDIIRFKGFKSGLYYYENDNALFSTYFKGMLLGVASYADAIYTPRKINGTYFDGSSDITTVYWGNARDFNISDNSSTYIGPTSSVHGDKNITLKLPNVIDIDIIGNASYSTTSGLSNNTNKQLIKPITDATKDYYFSFVQRINNVFAYTYSSVDLKYDPNKNAIHASYFNGWLDGNANKAVQLLFSYEINGTPFNGTKNITTAYWGNARNITITDYHNTYSYLNPNIDGGSNFVLKLPENIHANLHGNADTSTYSVNSDLANRSYRSRNIYTSNNSTYVITFTPIPSEPTIFSYSYFNNNLEYNPYNEELTSSYFHANQLFRGQLRAQDQWGIL